MYLLSYGAKDVGTESRWAQWLKDWREIADKSTEREYVPIFWKSEGVLYELLRVSRFCEEIDSDVPHVKTSIREFNEKTALHSRATRDLGILRVITNRHQPAFLLEPGAHVLGWRAKTQGVSEKKLVQVMRAGDLGRRVRLRDRKALKASREQLVAVAEVLNKYLEDSRSETTRLALLLEETKVRLQAAEHGRN